jgi:sarcosine oxidase
MATATTDVIVIGCGGFGSAAMHHLASRGLRVTGIDRFHPPHDRGSSHGETRIIRKAYFEHPDYVPLLHRAWELWERLEQHSETKLLERRSLLITGPPDSEVTEGARRAAAQHALPLMEISCNDVADQYPMFAVPDNHHCLIESTAGFLWCEECVRVHLDLARSHGAILRPLEIVFNVEPSTAGVTVRTNRGHYSAAAAVITCGAWTSQVQAEYARLISVRRKTLFWHPIQSPDWTDTQRAPIFFMDLPEGQFYGLPSVDGQTIKVGEHTGGQIVADPNLIRREITSDDSEPVKRFVTTRLRHVAEEARHAAVCLYSMSPDGHFLFDRHTEYPLVTAAGFSGHGFKFTSVLGEAVADLIQQGRTELPVEFLSAKRFKDTSGR